MPDFNEAIRFANSYTRMPILLDHMPELDDIEQFKSWLAVLGGEWSCCDNVGQHTAHLIEPLEQALRAGINGLMMTDDERYALSQLPDEFTVYRGCYEFNANGLSWTTCRDIAEGFTNLTRYNNHNHVPILRSRTIKRTDVVAYKLERDELEIILLPETQS